MAFINIGFGNMMQANKILSIITPDSAPSKRLIGHAREQHQLIDATQGRKTRGIIITDNGNIILSALQPDTIASRIKESEDV